MDGHTRAPKGSREWLEYWREEERRCREGYSVGDIAITGRHYHYLNYWKISRKKRGEKTKGLLPPKFLDIDYEFYWHLEKCFETGKDMLVLKRRQCGFSYKSSQLGGYNFTFLPASKTIYTAGEEKYAKETFGFMLEGLDNSKGTAMYRNRLDNEKDFIRAGYKMKVEGQWGEYGYKSQCYRITSTDLQALVGKSPFMVIYEEVGKFPGFLEVKKYIDPGMETEGEKTGWNICIGTGGEENESITEVGEAFYDPDTFGFFGVDNIWDDPDQIGDEELVMEDAPVVPAEQKSKVCFFVPGYMYGRGKGEVDEDGNSIIDVAKANIMTRRAALTGKRGYLQEVTQYPMTPQEALMVPSGGKFNVVKLRSQLAHVMRTPKLRDIVRRGEIDYVYTGGAITGVNWKDHPMGRFHMIEPPYISPKDQKVPEGLYVAGTDSYDRDQTVDSAGSFGSCYIYKTFHSALQTSNMFVCRITERPATREEFYDDTIKLCMLYGHCQNLIEYSNLLIGEHYMKKGFAYLLKDRPEIAYQLQKSVGAQTRWGVDPATKPFWIQKLKDYIEDYSGLLFDRHTINKLLKYRDKLPDGKPYNCDDTIAMALAITHAQDNIVVMDQEEEKPFLGLSYVMQGGQIQRSGW